MTGFLPLTGKSLIALPTGDRLVTASKTVCQANWVTHATTAENWTCEACIRFLSITCIATEFCLESHAGGRLVQRRNFHSPQNMSAPESRLDPRGIIKGLDSANVHNRRGPGRVQPFPTLSARILTPFHTEVKLSFVLIKLRYA